MVGRTNAGGGGGGVKMVSGSAYITQAKNTLIATVDFTPLVIYTDSDYSMYTSSGSSTSAIESMCSYREKATDSFSAKNPNHGSSAIRAAHSYDAATGNVYYQPEQVESSRTNNVHYVIMGV